MITQNGLNLFKMLLTNSCPEPSAFTDIDSNTNYLTSLEATGTYFPDYQQYINGLEGSVVSGTFGNPERQLFMPWFRIKTTLLNSDTYTSYWSTATTLTSAFKIYNYSSETEQTITLAAGDTAKRAWWGMNNNYGARFANVTANGDGVSRKTLNVWVSLGIAGNYPSTTEYFTITLPKCFGEFNSMDVGNNTFGMREMKIFSNLGYSNSVESVDDYDLNLPVSNKKLNPTEMRAVCSDSKIEFTISFKNFESESISVNEFGLYNYSSSSFTMQPYNPISKLSFSGYKFGNYGNVYVTLYDEVYYSRGYRPNLIARKVLPQTITIPPDGVATFKYTIDLSEMKAQENIAYEQA